jgi:hypothetical protein
MDEEVGNKKHEKRVEGCVKEERISHGECAKLKASREEREWRTRCNEKRGGKV